MAQTLNVLLRVRVGPSLTAAFLDIHLSILRESSRAANTCDFAEFSRAKVVFPACYRPGTVGTVTMPS